MSMLIQCRRNRLFGRLPAHLIVGLTTLCLLPALLAQAPTPMASPASALNDSCTAQTSSTSQHYPTLQMGDRSQLARYRLQHDDVLIISFPLVPELNETSTVQPDGYFSLLNASPVSLGGLTLAEAKKAIQGAYTGILQDPVLSIDLKDYQKPSYTVLGQVKLPGRYDLRYTTNLAEGMAVAGGLTGNSKTQVFLFRRVSCTQIEVTQFNLRRVLNGKHVSEIPFLQPGDILFVPEKFITNFRKYIPYGVGTDFSPGIGNF
jgi:polysaccharide export outer membrane protein